MNTTMIDTRKKLRRSTLKYFFCAPSRKVVYKLISQLPSQLFSIQFVDILFLPLNKDVTSHMSCQSNIHRVCIAGMDNYILYMEFCSVSYSCMMVLYRIKSINERKPTDMY